VGCQQCGRRPGDLYCLNDDGCPNDPQYEPRQDWACEPAPTGKDLKHFYCYETPCKECAADGVTGNAAKQAASDDKYLLPRCFRCGHLLHAGECVNVAPSNA
jgi:hypothetical protein